jgi:hypothetical protein
MGEKTVRKKTWNNRGKKKTVRKKRGTIAEHSKSRNISQTLSSTLFNCYLDDVLRLPLEATPMAFADDLNVVGDSVDTSNLAISINSDLSEIAVWFSDNRLKLNPEKTKILIFAAESVRLELSGPDGSPDHRSCSFTQITGSNTG